jgi:hypothetical protein
MTSIGNKWTKKEESQLLSEINKNIDYDNIAKIHNRNVNGIAARVRHIAYEMYKNNISIDEIMRITKLSKDQVDDVIKRRQIKGNEITSTYKESNTIERPTKYNIMNEIITLKSDIEHIKKDVRELLSLLHSIYDFE